MNSESAMMTYQLLLGVGVVLLLTGTISSLLMKRVPPKMIFGELKHLFFFNFLRLFRGALNSIFFKYFWIAGIWLIVSAFGCVALNIFTEFNLTVLSFVIFLSCCSSSNIVLAVGVNLFPTKYRGMSSSLIMMFGRLGGSAGSTLVGILLAQYCSSIFYIYGVMLISEFHWRSRDQHNFWFVSLFSGCVCIFFTINTTSLNNAESNGLKSSKKFKTFSVTNSIQVKWVSYTV